MLDLDFAIENVEVAPFAAAPLLLFKLRVANADAGMCIQSVALTCQIKLEVARRHYRAGDHERLRDLFGERERWSQTLHSMLWTFASAGVPSFSGSTVVDLPVPCTYDFNVAATKYFYGLNDGDVPLTFLFSGTVFYPAEDGTLQVDQIPWDKEATFRLPVQVWSAMMAHYYPNGAWLRLRRDVFDRLYRYKVGRGLPTWEQAFESLMDALDVAV